MTVEMTPLEAELLIAVLTGAEWHFLVSSPALSEALEQLRPWRSALLQAYLRHRLSSPEVSAAIDGAFEARQSGECE